jgi:hypothetical protein
MTFDGDRIVRSDITKDASEIVRADSENPLVRMHASHLFTGP